VRGQVLKRPRPLLRAVGAVHPLAKFLGTPVRGDGAAQRLKPCPGPLLGASMTQLVELQPQLALPLQLLERLAGLRGLLGGGRLLLLRDHAVPQDGSLRVGLRQPLQPLPHILMPHQLLV
jgi:hypothetical protein